MVRGNTTNHGNYKGPRHHNYTDYTGEVHKGMTFLERGDLDKHKRTMWKVKCHCGKIFQAPQYDVRHKIKSCGCMKYKTGKDHWAWKGGRCEWKDQNGYVRVEVNDGEGNKYEIMEHREVMETKIGRKLLDHETVHHINGVRDDNRIENLELWSSSHPSGQRIEDKVKWAKEILELYEYDDYTNSLIDHARKLDKECEEWTDRQLRSTYSSKHLKDN